MTIGLGILGGVAGGAAINVIINGVDNFSSTFDNVQKRTNMINRKLLATGAGLTAIGVGGAIGIKKLSDEAIKFESVMFGVNAKVSDGEALLKKLQKATAGTVSDFQLMKGASTALQLGLSEEALPAMAEFSSKVGPALGETAEFMFDSIVRGVGRASPLILDNLGLVIDVQKEYQKWADANGVAASEIDKATKLQIIQNAVMEEAKERGMDLEGALDTAAAKQAKLSAQFDNAKVKLGQALLPAVIKVTNALSALVGWFDGLSPAMRKVIAVTALIVTALGLIGGPILMLIAILPAFSGGLTILTGAIGAVTAVSAPWLIIILAVIAAITAIVLLIKNWDKVLEFFKKRIKIVGLQLELFKNIALTVWEAAKFGFVTMINFVIETATSGIRKLLKIFQVAASAIGQDSLADRIARQIKKIEAFRIDTSGITENLSALSVERGEILKNIGKLERESLEMILPGKKQSGTNVNVNVEGTIVSEDQLMTKMEDSLASRLKNKITMLG